jgi:hypothetical protein
MVIAPVALTSTGPALPDEDVELVMVASSESVA